MDQATQILDFWESQGPKGWWTKNPELDREIENKFGDCHARAAAGQMNDWRKSADQSLALVILLDQFSRNIYRGQPAAFACNRLTVEIANEAIAAGFDKQVREALKSFFYLPFMHSEQIEDQNRCVLLMHANGGEDNLKHAIEHREIIARFGRFPHRNGILGRHTTPAEAKFLADGGFKG